MTDSVTTQKSSNWNLLGHEWAVDMLKQHITRQAVRHAYLFTGPSGVGKRSLALRYAQALNCTQTSTPGQYCGNCRDCKQIEAMQHPDLSIVQAEYEGGTLKVDQVREVRRRLTLKPYQAKYRVALFMRFQETSKGAANALLKTLEETPEYAILILTASSPEDLLATITSRCEVLRLRPLSIETVENQLRSQGVQPEQAKFIAHISNGRPGYAQRLLNDNATLAFRSERLADLIELLSATRVQKFKYAEGLAKDKEAMRDTLLVWLSYWRDVFLRICKAGSPITNIDQSEAIAAIAEKLDLRIAGQIVHEMELALRRLDRNTNPRLLAEVLLLNLPEG